MADPSTLPDIFFTWAGAFCGDFAAQGNVYCLNDAYKAYADQLPEVMMQNASYGENGDHYAVPLTMNIVTLFANMDLLKQAGWDKIPETYEDLIACCDALVAAGKIPFGCAGKETWCVTEYLEPIMEKYFVSASMAYDRDYSIFIRRPISLVILIITVVIILVILIIIGILPAK